MVKFVIIVAGGKGLRMGGEIPKQFLPLNGKPVLMHTLERFVEYDENIKIIVVLPQFQIDYWKHLCEQHQFTIAHICIAGGEERFHSVKNGLECIDNADSLVAIHDGVRPLVNVETISRCFEVASKKGNAIPVIDVADSVRIIEEGRNSPIDRNMVKLVQTPQIFSFSLLQYAYNQTWHSQLTDDASVIESAGNIVYLTEGNRENIKITNPFDFVIAESIISKRIKNNIFG